MKTLRPTNITHLPAIAYMEPRRAERQGNLTAILTRDHLFLRWHATRRSPVKNIIGELSAPLSTFDARLTPQMSLFKFLRAHCPVWFEKMEWHMRNEKKK